MVWQTQRLKHGHGPPSRCDVLAPDGSEIRLLVQVSGGSLVHCALQPGRVTRAVSHRSVEEVWFCLAGAGQLWRREAATAAEEIVPLEPGVAVSLPAGTTFQFRAVGPRTLELVITTMPPWPGPDEAIPAAGVWQARLG